MNGLCDYQFFVRANDAHRDLTGRHGNHVVIRRVSILFEFDPKKT
jgi:hypothetical protein